MLLENLGIDRAIRFGKLGDWKAAIEDLETEATHQAPAVIRSTYDGPFAVTASCSVSACVL